MVGAPTLGKRRVQGKLMQLDLKYLQMVWSLSAMFIRTTNTVVRWDLNPWLTPAVLMRGRLHGQLKAIVKDQ